MPKFRFSEIAFNSTAKKKPTEEDKYTYIGLEHLDSGNLTVSRWGSDVAPVGEKLLMKKGDVLFGKRRAYQKKVAISPFDGIFSAHGMVLRPNEKIVTKEYFPLFISSDYFLDEAIRISVGSLSPTVNWKDLKDIEFDLPTIEEQERLTPIIWAAIEAKNAYKKQLDCIDDLVKSQFIEMFGDPVENEKEWPVYPLSKIASSRLGKMLDKKKQTGLSQRKYLANANVQWFSFDLNDLNQMDFNEDDQQEFSLVNGDLLVCEGGEVGRCAVWHEEINDCYFQKAIHRVRCNTGMILPEYLAHSFFYHSQKNGFADVVSSKATIAHLPGDKLKSMGIIVPPIELQQQFVSFAEQSEKSKFATQPCTLQHLMDAVIGQEA